jgi:hypothetical protein
MISTFIRAQWESGELEDVEDERRQILEESPELDHIWGVWEAEKEPTNAPRKWIRQPSQSGNDMRHHVEVHASHREKEWEYFFVSVRTNKRHHHLGVAVSIAD